MDERLKNHAVLLFEEKYGKNPEAEGLKVDYYQEKDMFLYSTSQEAIDAFKSYQNALMWTLKYFCGLLLLCLAIEAFVLFKIAVAPVVYAYAGLATCIFAGIALFVIYLFCAKNEKKTKEFPVIFIPNEEDED